MAIIVSMVVMLEQIKVIADQILMCIVLQVLTVAIEDFVLLLERSVVAVLAICGCAGGLTADIDLTIRGLLKQLIPTQHYDFKE